MNIQSTQINPSLKKRHQKIVQLQSKLNTELSGLQDQADSKDFYSADRHMLDSFVDDQRVSTHTAKLSSWKTAAKVVTGALGGALLGYQGGALGGIGNGALAAAGITFASIQEGDAPDIGEIPNGLLAAGAVALPGVFGGVPGAVAGAIAGGLAASFGNMLFE